jgi:hypothetical protein
MNQRSTGLDIGVASRYSVPSLQMFGGYFAGALAGWVAEPVQIFQLPQNGCFLFSMSFSSLLFFAALRRCKQGGFLSHVFVFLLLIVIALVERPYFLSEGLAHVPIFKSFKWPFRQLMFLHFFITLWIALNLGRFSLRHAWKLMLPGLLITGLSLHEIGRPSFNDYGDRRLILSGAAEKFWATVRREIPEDAVLVGLDDLGLIRGWRYPLCLTGAVNFPAMYQVRMAGGYSFSKPCNTVRTNFRCDPFYSLYRREDIPALLSIYRKLYVTEIISYSSVRVGVLDSDFTDFLANAKTMNFADTNELDFSQGNFSFHKGKTDSASEQRITLKR